MPCRWDKCTLKIFPFFFANVSKLLLCWLHCPLDNILRKSNSIKSIFSSCSFNMSSDSVNVYGKHTVEVEPIPHYKTLTIVLKPIEGQISWNWQYLDCKRKWLSQCYFFRNELRLVIIFLFHYIKSFPLSACCQENRLWWC